MAKMKNKVLSLYDCFLIVGVIASNIVYSVLSGDLDPVGSIASIAGVLCVVLVAKGNIWNYLFGNSFTRSFSCFHRGLLRICFFRFAIVTSSKQHHHAKQNRKKLNNVRYFHIFLLFNRSVYIT